MPTHLPLTRNAADHCCQSRDRPVAVERLLQYLDDLEDLIYAAPLIAEQLRRAILRILVLLGSICLQVAGVVLALYHPPLALAVVSLLLVGMLLRAVVIPVRRVLATR